MLFHITARVRVTGQGRLAAIAYCMHSHVEWALHGEKREGRRWHFLSRDFWTTRQLKDYLRTQEVASVEEYLGWSRGKAKGLMPSTAYDRPYRSSLDHGRTYSSFFSSLSHEAFLYSSFFLRVMFLFGEPKRSSTAAVAPKTNATLSLPSLWLRLSFSLDDPSTRR